MIRMLIEKIKIAKTSDDLFTQI